MREENHAVFTNAQVIAQARDTDARLARVETALVALTTAVAALAGAPATSAPATPVASAPIVPALAREATPKAVFTCVAHAAPSTPACVREFGKAESLAAHNAWAHKS